MKQIQFAVVSIVALYATPVCADVRFGSGNISFPTLIAQANTEAYNLDIEDDQASSVSQVSLILSPHGSATVDADAQSVSYLNGTPSILATDSEFGIATFENAASATIEFSGLTFAQSLVENAYTNAGGGVNYFGYGFTVDSNSMFRLKYNFVSDSLSSDFNNSIKLIDEGGTTLIDETSVTNSMGAYTAGLVAGHSYDLIINNFNSLANDRIDLLGAGTMAGGYDNSYALDISATAAVPEPTTWSMMIIGIGLVGARRRTHRRSADKFAADVRGIASASPLY